MQSVTISHLLAEKLSYSKQEPHMRRTVFIVLSLSITAALLLFLFRSSPGSGEERSNDNSASLVVGRTELPLGDSTALSSKEPHDTDQPAPSVEALMDLFEATRSPADLVKAQQLYPDNFDVISVSASLATRLDDPWLQKLRTKFPENSLADVISVAICVKNKDKDSVLRLLEQLPEGKALDLGVRERLASRIDESLRNGTKLEGVSSVDKLMYAMSEPLADLLGKSAPPGTEMEHYASQVIKLSQLFRGTKDVASLLTAFRLEQDVLARISPNTEYGDAGITARDRIEQLRLEDRDLLILNKNVARILAAKPEIVIQYWQKVRDVGRLPAMEWLDNQPTDATGK